MIRIPTNKLYDFPIQFKEINHSDFPNYTFEDSEKTILVPDEKGYISDELWDAVDLEKKDTTIINAGVGQGKTKAIIDFIKWYYDETINNNGKYKIIIITPFKSLNKEYISKIIEVTKEDDIFFDYENLGLKGSSRIDFDKNSSKPIQLISIMSILGDPGKQGFEQSAVKREYYKYIYETCEYQNEKVILFFDELHESLNSFTPELLPNLFLWRKVVHKIIVASATFSESSKTPIKFFAELTERKIKIIESKRFQNQNNLSELFLCLYNNPTINVEDVFIKDIFDEFLTKNSFSTVNILVYDPNISKELFKSSIGKLIENKFGSIKLCVGNSTNNSFDKNYCNIGTTFKTGISIEKENSGYIIILAPSYNNSLDKLGIFSDRTNSLIQALARPRKKAKILVITPSPKRIILKSDVDKSYIEKLSLGYLNLSESSFVDLKEQDTLLRKQYESTKNNIEEEIQYVANLDQEIKANFQNYDWFKLKRGDEFLRTHYDSFGKDLPSYLYWAAWNNQFVNCKLAGIIIKQAMWFSEGNIQSELDRYIPLRIINEKSFIDIGDKEVYHKIRNMLRSNNLYYKKIVDKEPQKFKTLRFLFFEQQIIHFLQRRKTPYLFEPEYGCEYSFKNGNKPIDKAIDKEMYIRTCISQCKHIDERADKLPKDELQIVNAYNDLYTFKNILLNEYVETNEKGFHILQTDKNFKFKNMHLIKLKSIFTLLLEYDLGFKIFNTRSILNEKPIYSLLRKLFFETEVTKNDKNKNCLRVDGVIPIEYSEYKLNLIYNVAEPFIYYPVPPNNELYKIEINDDMIIDLDKIDSHITPIQNNNE
ncbi:conserved hypothetical protein [Flavobacterium psychrophilum]|uniref:DEAD/DEAH box helicase n=1 Tax=Flavobacterium psychrophilum TaxID=96345 RepID=UPI000B7C3097|nr:DEAD/DEAH box helicase [Flavobacterium psychrophilum]SNB22462.1 conserved hypothetical protein [Flavobacterium psychrophilum]